LDLPIRADRLPDPPPVYRWLASQPGDFAALELPTYYGSADASYQFWQTVHWKRIVNGAVGFYPAGIVELVEGWDPLDPDALATRIRSIYPVRYVVVHREILSAADRARWESLGADPIPGLRLLRTIEAADVYELALTPQSGADIRRYFSTDYVRRHPVAEVAFRFPPDPDVVQWVDISFNGRPVGRVERGGRQTIVLPPPYQDADRNELRFRHRYELARGRQVDPARYRIGRTAVLAPADIEVLSAGKEHGNHSSIRVNGLEVSP